MNIDVKYNTGMIPLSIITVCFNEANRIKLTCESIVNQTFQDFEWIVIDGGSTDGTVDILKQYQAHMNYFVSEPDRGIYHAMNKGMAHAHGEYYQFLNGGDYLYKPESLEKAFQSRTQLDADLFYGDLLFERETEVKRYVPDSSNCYAMLVEHVIPHSSAFMKHTLFETYGIYDESWKIVGDLDFFLRVFVSSKDRKQHVIEHLPFIVAVFESEQGISSKNITQRRTECFAVRKQHYPAWYIGAHYTRKWAMRQKKRVFDSARYRFNKYIRKTVSCRK